MIHSVKIRNCLKLILLAGGLMGLPPAASAHHSFAMFDARKTVTVEGTVKTFLYENPHVWIVVTAKNDKGEYVDFQTEGTPPLGAAAMGILASTFKQGDKISLVINPYRDGRPGGAWIEVIDAHGVVHKKGGGAN